MNKITFNEKENSVVTNSLYILNANNINEIKEVINNIIDKFEMTDFKFFDVFKFINISIPKFYIENDYELVIEFSSLNTFGISKSISSKTNNNLFYIFNDDSYINFSNLEKTTINKNDIEKTILIDISNVSLFNNIEDLNNRKYFGRYYFKLNNEIASEYFGILLGSTEFSFEKVNLNKTLTTLSNTDFTFNHSYKNNIELFNNIIEEGKPFKLQTTIQFNNELLDVTNLTEYSFDESYIELIGINEFVTKNCNLNKILQIKCVTNFKYQKYYSKINLLVLNNTFFQNLNLNFIFNNNINNQLILNSTEKKEFDIILNYKNFNKNESIKYSDNINNNIFDIIYDENLFEIDGTTITAKDVIVDTLTSIKINYLYNDNIFSEEFPITIIGTSQNYGISVEFSNKILFSNSLNNQYNVYLLDLNGNKFDITTKTEVILLNDQTKFLQTPEYKILNNVTFLNHLKIFNVSEISKTFNLEILFRYFDEKLEKTFETFDTIKLISSDEEESTIIFKNLNVEIPYEMFYNEFVNYKIFAELYKKDTNELINYDVTDNCEIIHDDYLIFENKQIHFNNEYLCDLTTNKQKLITIKYTYKDITYEKHASIIIKPKNIIDIYIEGDDILDCAKTSSEYKVFIKYEDGEIKDITNNPNLNLHLNNGALAFLNNNKITTSILHKPYDIILYASYKDGGCDSLIYNTHKNIHVLKYVLKYTEIKGNDSIFSNKSEEYYTNAIYSNNDVIDHVSAMYTVSDISGNIFNETNSPIDLTYNNETNTISIYAKKRLDDLNIILSSYYEEPKYEKFENYTTSKNILILGGFNVKLYGTLLTYDELNDSIKYINFESPSSTLIKDFTLYDDEEIKSYSWEQLEIIKTFENETTISPNEFINNYQCYYWVKIFRKLSSGEWFNVGNMSINSKFNFKASEYKIIYCTVSDMVDAKFSYIKFDLNFNFNNSYILGLSGLYFEDGFQIMNPSATFITSTGFEFNESFKYDVNNDIWLLKNIPSKATIIKDVTVAFAFSEQ